MASISRMTIPAVMACLVLGTACSESSAGPPPLPSCGAHGTPLALAVGAYTSIDPASDAGCVTFAANTAPDTAEYLVLPWSTVGTQYQVLGGVGCGIRRVLGTAVVDRRHAGGIGAL